MVSSIKKKKLNFVFICDFSHGKISSSDIDSVLCCISAKYIGRTLSWRHLRTILQINTVNITCIGVAFSDSNIVSISILPKFCYDVEPILEMKLDVLRKKNHGCTSRDLNQSNMSHFSEIFDIQFSEIIQSVKVFMVNAVIQERKIFH